jgi:hypothetical protein
VRTSSSCEAGCGACASGAGAGGRRAGPAAGVQTDLFAQRLQVLRVDELEVRHFLAQAVALDHPLAPLGVEAFRAPNQLEVQLRGPTAAASW